MASKLSMGRSCPSIFSYGFLSSATLTVTDSLVAAVQVDFARLNGQTVSLEVDGGLTEEKVKKEFGKEHGFKFQGGPLLIMPDALSKLLEGDRDATTDGNEWRARSTINNTIFENIAIDPQLTVLRQECASLKYFFVERER